MIFQEVGPNENLDVRRFRRRRHDSDSGGGCGGDTKRSHRDGVYRFIRRFQSPALFISRLLLHQLAKLVWSLS